MECGRDQGTMDNLTHTLIGVGIAKAGLSQRLGRGTTFTLALTSNLTDIDALWAFAAGGDAILYRRMLTHSVFGIPVLAAFAAYLLRFRYAHLPWKTLFGLSLLGMGVHAFFDLLNSYGVVAFYPLSRHRYELAWVFIIDLFLWGVLLVPLLFTWIPAFDIKVLSRFSLFVVALYLALCATGRTRSYHLLKDHIAKQGASPDFMYVFPEALGCHRFRGAVRYGETYVFYLIHPFQKRLEMKQQYQTHLNDPDVRQAREHPVSKDLEWFFKAPVWQEEGSFIRVFDLRFLSLVVDRAREPFVFWFKAAPTGNIEYLGRHK